MTGPELDRLERVRYPHHASVVIANNRPAVTWCDRLAEAMTRALLEETS